MPRGSVKAANSDLKSFVNRIEALEDEKRGIASDIRDVYAEAKLAGLNVKALREVIKRRTWDRDKLAEHDAAVDDYKAKLGMLVGTPLGDAAMTRINVNLTESGKMVVTQQ